jgi:hypothetical protein
MDTVLVTDWPVPASGGDGAAGTTAPVDGDNDA